VGDSAKSAPAPPQVEEVYDQPQLARAVRWAIGRTPGELRSGILARPTRFGSIQDGPIIELLGS
jgi:hypothetical protein